MIKVVSFTSGAWHEVSNENSCAYTCSYLDRLLDEGWKIKDWKMMMSHGSRGWTFILEKESNQNSNSNIKKINDTCLQVYHWQFIIEDTDEYTVNVYETRYANIIGHLKNNITLPEIEKGLNNFSEEQVYNWIDNNIKYF